MKGKEIGTDAPLFHIVQEKGLMGLREIKDIMMMVQFQGIIAEYERVKIMERLRIGKLHKLRRGILMTPKVAYGYRHILKRDLGAWDHCWVTPLPSISE